MLTGLNITLGVSGGIACYKACEIVSRLKKLGANVDVIMTKNATQLVQPLTFESLSSNAVSVDMFEPKKQYDIKHISLAKKSDLFVVAPATANVISKLANGIADDMLTTTALAITCKLLIAPAMNSAMYLNKTTKENIKKLQDKGAIFVGPSSGRLACGDDGVGKMSEPIEIVEKIVQTLIPTQDYKGKTVLVTCGATRENLDGVRFITNRSSGKMGVEIAKAAKKRGAKVILVKGLTTCKIPSYFEEVISVESTINMRDAVLNKCENCDIIIKAAAPSDYRLEQKFENKIKGDTLTLNLVKNPDIAKEVGKIKGDKKLVIFCAETTDLENSAAKKLESKNADLVVANDVTKPGAGFDTDTNIVTLINRKHEIKHFPLLAKSEVADIILDEILSL